MGLGTFFTGLDVAYGGLSVPTDVNFLLPVLTTVPAILGGMLGAFLGWFNVAIMTLFGADEAVTTAAPAPSR